MHQTKIPRKREENEKSDVRYRGQLLEATAEFRSTDDLLCL